MEWDVRFCSCSKFSTEQDMVAHSACDFGGGKAEKLALARYRKHLWHGRVVNSRFTNKELRNKGRCPLTPEEIGLTLAAMGFDGRTRLFLATHKVSPCSFTTPGALQKKIMLLLGQRILLHRCTGGGPSWRL